MTESDRTKARMEPAGPADAFAAATAVGFAMASQALELWFGVMSGVARAGQEMLERHKEEFGPPRAYPAATKEAVRGRAEAAGGYTAKPAGRAGKTSKESDLVSNVVALKPKAVAEAMTELAKPAARGKAQTFAAATPRRKIAKPTAEVPAQAKSSAPPKADLSTTPTDFRAPKAIARPESPDDLKQLPGVGPKLEKVLNGLGVWAYAQVAAWTPEEIAYVEDLTGLSGRITADKWLEGAAALAGRAGK